MSKSLSGYLTAIAPIIEKYVNRNDEIEVRQLTTDSRNVTSGTLFIAIEGKTVNGKNYISTAIQSGAKVIVFSGELPQSLIDSNPTISFICLYPQSDYQAAAMLFEYHFDYPARRFKLIGVTGTNGKTTTSYLINHILRAAGKKTTLIGTVAYDINGTITPATHTTPDAEGLQKIFLQSTEAGIDYLVMEISSHAADQYRCGTTEFQTIAFTNLTGEHLDYHNNMESYFQAKRTVFDNNLDIVDGTAIINTDDSFGQRLFEEFGGEEFGSNSSITGFNQDMRGISFNLKEQLYQVPLYGRFNAFNCAAAILSCIKTGIRPESIAETLREFPGVPGRLQSVKLNNGAIAFVDYAHTDDALRNVSSSLKELPHNRLITVFGCGGDRDRTKRPRMAKAVAEFADVIIITADNSRSENIANIIADIRPGLATKNEVLEIPCRKEAITRAVEISENNDLILIAGKGHEDYQIENGITSHFSDYETLLALTKVAN